MRGMKPCIDFRVPLITACGGVETEQSELGYVTDSYKTDCSPIIAAGGGLRIEGLEIKGDIPREGKNYISSLFARGVHIDLIK